MKDYREQAREFLNSVFNELENYSLRVEPNQVDHLCYRTSSQNHYLETKKFFASQGVLLTEGIIGGRQIATYKLSSPIEYKNQNIDIIEVPSPKNGSYYPAGFEHLELVITESFKDFMKKHPDLEFKTKAISKTLNPDIKIQLTSGAVKFHHQTLEKVIEIENLL